MNEERHPPRHPPEGQDTYWIRAKTQAAITHLRDIEDWAIGEFGAFVPGETDEEFEARLANAPMMVLARRARECHEHITRDLKNGRATVRSLGEEIDYLRAENERLRSGRSMNVMEERRGP